MAESKIKYLVKGWKVDIDGIYQPFCDICDSYNAACVYLQLMAVRNEESMQLIALRNEESIHLKVDSIEAIWNTE